MSTLTPTARVILGLLAWEPRTGYDIKRVTDFSTRFFWGASYGQIYPELKRLAAAGLVRASDEPRGAVQRRVYELTAAGRRAVAAWLSEPEEIFEYRDEGLLKRFFGDLVGTDELRELLERRRRWHEEAAAYFRTLAEDLVQVDWPSSEVLRYGIEFMDWNAAWYADLEERLTSRE
jgi:DNA-binding PadR family transcriptional regulator